MKTILLIMVGAATMLVTAGCDEGHEHHGHYGGAYDGEYHDYGHGQWQNYPGHPGTWQRSDDWHPR
ncbi:MAG TPA: hypothetical protein VLT36_16650 [Candidatus Dormibacteraeota bacterium]|nr:hypothetical protein [Candidatus Dormibacteraeota bacterium]